MATTYESQNKRRAVTVTVASIIFILAVSSAFLCGLSIITLADVHSSVDNAQDYGYSEYYYNGEIISWDQFASMIENIVFDEYYNSGYYSSDTDSYYNPETNESFEDYDVYYEHRREQLITHITSENNPGELSDDEMSDSFYIVDVTPSFSFDEDKYNNYMGVLWLAEIISLVIIPISLFFVLLCCGQKDESGNVILIWADKILVEIQIALAAAVSLIVIPVFFLFESWLSTSSWSQNMILKLFPNSTWNNIDPWLSYWISGIYNRGYFNALFHPTWVMFVLAIVLTLIVAAFDLMVLTSIVKKIKAHAFWKSTLLGSVVRWIGNSINISRNLSLKIIGSLIAAVIFWSITTTFLFLWRTGDAPMLIIVLITLIFVLAIFLFVPKQIRKYSMVKHGLEEVQKGNFSYKVTGVENGELGNLANLVNSITAAQSEAVNRELKSQRLRTELISNVSHDLRTPLTSMVSYVDLLKSEGLTGEHGAEYLDIISEKTERLQKLTEDLFEAAKASSGDIPVNIEQIDMGAVVNQAIAELEENFTMNEIELIYTNKAEDSTVLADGNLLWRVIENLMVNVSKYAMQGSRAYVDIIDSNDKIALEVKNVSNYSLNISADELMERFQRGDDSRNTDGSGLGLAIVNDLTSLMNGNFDLYVDGDLFKATVAFLKA